MLTPSDACKRKRIAVCADDFGLHGGINDAVMVLARGGRITAIACMVGGPAWAAGARELQTLRGDHVDIGLHLDFTEFEAPHSLPRLIVRACTRRLDAALVRERIHAQLGAFEQAIGRAPDFVDGHQHVHQLPVIGDALLEPRFRS